MSALTARGGKLISMEPSQAANDPPSAGVMVPLRGLNGSGRARQNSIRSHTSKQCLAFRVKCQSEHIPVEQAGTDLLPGAAARVVIQPGLVARQACTHPYLLVGAAAAHQDRLAVIQRLAGRSPVGAAVGRDVHSVVLGAHPHRVIRGKVRGQGNGEGYRGAGVEAAQAKRLPGEPGVHSAVHARVAKRGIGGVVRIKSGRERQVFHQPPEIRHARAKRPMVAGVAGVKQPAVGARQQGLVAGKAGGDPQVGDVGVGEAHCDGQEIRATVGGPVHPPGGSSKQRVVAGEIRGNGDVEDLLTVVQPGGRPGIPTVWRGKHPGVTQPRPESSGRQHSLTRAPAHARPGRSARHRSR